MKPIIAVDIDDVLADTAEGFVEFSNQQWQTKLTPDDYSEDWMEMWQLDLAAVKRRGEQWFASGATRRLAHKPDSLEVLQVLKGRFDIIATTSRRSRLADETAEWLAVRYPDVFSAVHYAGIFDNPDHGVEVLTITKAELYKTHDVSYVIDDQLKHCRAAAELGIEALLFGDYPWNQTDALPIGVSRCANWRAVEAFFNERA